MSPFCPFVWLTLMQIAMRNAAVARHERWLKRAYPPGPVQTMFRADHMAMIRDFYGW